MKDRTLLKEYEIWTESAEYKSQSMLENGFYDKETQKIKECIGETQYYDISDEIMHIGSESEYTGFCNGFIYGINFMTAMVGGRINRE